MKEPDYNIFNQYMIEKNEKHEESFINKDVINQLKLRASVGSIGNCGVGAYSTYATLSRDYASYGTSTKYWGYWPESSSNPDLHWEKTVQYDLGFDLGVINNKVNLSADFYLKNTTDLLFQKELPDYNGGGTVWTNLGKLQNKGMEFTLNVVPFATKNLTWESTLTAAYNKNTVKDLGEDDYIIPDASRGGLYSGGLFILKVGKPVGSFYLQRWAGFDDEGANLYYNQDGTTTTDNNNDNRVITGKSVPDWLFGWNNTLTYKNWDFNVLFRATSNYDRLNISRYIETCQTGASRFISSREGYYRSWDKVADKSHEMIMDRALDGVKGQNILVLGDTNETMEGNWVNQLKEKRFQDFICNASVVNNTIGFDNNGKQESNTLSCIDQYMNKADKVLNGLNKIFIMGLTHV